MQRNLDRTADNKLILNADEYTMNVDGKTYRFEVAINERILRGLFYKAATKNTTKRVVVGPLTIKVVGEG